MCVCRYWHRSLNPRKLIEIKFSHLSRNMTMQRTMKLYRLPEVDRVILSHFSVYYSDLVITSVTLAPLNGTYYTTRWECDLVLKMCSF